MPIRSIMPMCSKKVTFKLSMSCCFLNDLFTCSDTLVSLMKIPYSFPETSTSYTNWQSRASHYHANFRPAFRDDLLRSYAELYFNFGVKIITEKTNAQSHIVCTGRKWGTRQKKTRLVTGTINIVDEIEYDGCNKL